MRHFFLLFLLFVFSTPVFAGSFEDIAKDISSKVLPQKGLIIGVEENTVRLDKGESDGLFKGEVVFIYRLKGVVKDPYSGEIFQVKKGLAYAKVVDLRKNSAQAEIIEGAEEEKDRVLGLIPKGFKKIVIPARTGDRWEAGTTVMRVGIVTRKSIIYENLKQTLEEMKRFHVVDADEFQIALAAKKIVDLNSKKSRAEIGKELNLEMLIFANVEDNNIRCRVFSGYDGERIAVYKSALSKKTEAVIASSKEKSIPVQNIVPSPLELKPRLTFYEKALNKFGFYAPLHMPFSTPTFELITSSNLRSLSTAFYMGDIDNDGKIEIIVALGKKVTVFRFNGDSFNPVMSFHHGWNIFNIDCADINNDGIKELLFSNFSRFGNLSSFTGLIKGNKFYLIKDKIRYYIRVYKRFEKPVIIAQKSGITCPFYGKIYKISETGKIEDELKLPISPRTLFDFYKIDEEIIYLDKDGKLGVYDEKQEKVLYKTSISFGRNTRPIERYGEHPAIVSKSLIVFKEKNKICAMVANNIRESSVSLRSEEFFGGNIKIYEIGERCFHLIWNSGDTAGRISGFSKIDNTIISVREMPTPVLTRLIKGKSGVDVLTAGRIKY